MNIEVFAQKHSVKIKRDACNDLTIQGKSGHIGDGYSDSWLGVYLSCETPKTWTYAKKKLVASGMRVRQDGDMEGVLLFDPTNRAQVRLALKAASIFPKRRTSVPSPAQLAARAAFANSRGTVLKRSGHEQER